MRNPTSLSRTDRAKAKKFFDSVPQVEAFLARYAADDPEARRLHGILVALADGGEASTGSVYLAHDDGEAAALDRDIDADAYADVAYKESVEIHLAAQAEILKAKAKGETLSYIDALRRVEIVSGLDR